MKHEFTDQQLDNAMGASYEVTGDEDILEVSFEGIRAFLDALPEPQDDWEACAFEDIQKGDRVKWFYRDKDRENTCIGVAHRLAYANEAWVTENGAIVADISVQGQFYRIPAPVQHPDPKEHPVILVTKIFDTEHDEPIPMIWDGGTYYESPKGRFHVESITDWSPAKVVADNE